MSRDDEAEGDGQEALHSIDLSDLLSMQLTTIESATIVPSFSIGTRTVNDEKVLVPLMSCILHGTFGEDDDETPVSAVLAFDNLAFLAMRLADALKDASDDIAKVSQGGLTPSHDRIEYARRCLSRGAADLAAAADQLGELAGQTAQQGAADPA